MASSPFLFPSTFISNPSESTPSSSSSPVPPSFCSNRSNSSFSSPYKSSPSLPPPTLSLSSSSRFPPANFGPCAACKFYSRQCSDDCHIASFLPPDELHNFAVVDSVFGSGNVVNFIQHNSNTSYTPLLLLLRDTSREDEVNSDPETATEINNQKKAGESVNLNPMSELIQGRKRAEQLKLHLSSGSSYSDGEDLVQKILSSIDKSLSILIRRGDRINQQPNDAAPVVNTNSHLSRSPVQMDASPATDNFNGSVNSNAVHVNKRKTLPRWTDNVTVISDGGLEEALDDGYSWIKYGQKEVLGAKYPRGYYRCIHRNTQNCWATKRVKRSDEDPTVFEVSYRRLHTCSDSPQSVPSPALLERREQINISRSDQQQQLQGTLFNFLPSANSPFLDIDLTRPPLELDLSLN